MAFCVLFSQKKAAYITRVFKVILLLTELLSSQGLDVIVPVLLLFDAKTADVRCKRVLCGHRKNTTVINLPTENPSFEYWHDLKLQHGSSNIVEIKEPFRLNEGKRSKLHSPPVAMLLRPHSLRTLPLDLQSWPAGRVRARAAPLLLKLQKIVRSMSG